MDNTNDFLSKINELVEEAETSDKNKNKKNQESEQLFDNDKSKSFIDSEKEEIDNKNQKKLIKSEIRGKSDSLYNNGKYILKKDANIHEGHRERVRFSVDNDPDFTTFSDHQILEYLLFNTIKRVDTNKIAHELINTFGTFSGVLNASIAELKKVPYINESVARMLTSIIPAARRAELSRFKNSVFITTTNEAVEYLSGFFMNRNRELLYLACLDHADRVINVNLISHGDTSYTEFKIKKVIQTACSNDAEKVILAHNHPAGSIEPSPADINATSKLMLALGSMGILLIDHIIFTSNDYYSFFQNDDMEEIYSRCDRTFGTTLFKELRQRKIKSALKGQYVFESDRND